MREMALFQANIFGGCALPVTSEGAPNLVAGLSIAGVFAMLNGAAPFARLKRLLLVKHLLLASSGSSTEVFGR